MAESKKTLHEALRAGYMERVRKFLESEGEEVLVTGTNEFALPCVDSAGNDEFMVITSFLFGLLPLDYIYIIPQNRRFVNRFCKFFYELFVNIVRP